VPDKPPLVHHIYPYLCCHLQHVAGSCPMGQCDEEPCNGPDCWWYDKREEPPGQKGHVASKWIEVRRYGTASPRPDRTDSTQQTAAKRCFVLGAEPAAPPE